MFSFDIRSPYPLKHDTFMFKPGKPPVVMGRSEVILPMGASPSVMTMLVKQQWNAAAEDVKIYQEQESRKLSDDYPWLAALLWPINDIPKRWGFIFVKKLPVAVWERPLNGVMQRKLTILWSSDGNVNTLLRKWVSENEYIEIHTGRYSDLNLTVHMSGSIRASLKQDDDEIRERQTVKLG